MNRLIQLFFFGLTPEDFARRKRAFFRVRRKRRGDDDSLDDAVQCLLIDPHTGAAADGKITEDDLDCPTPEEIAAACEELQAAWSEKVRKSRVADATKWVQPWMPQRVDDETPGPSHDVD